MKIYALIGAFGVIAYALPSIIAVLLRRAYWRRLFLCNLVTGFTWAGWLGTLSWALTNKPYPFDARTTPKTRLASFAFLGFFVIEIGAMILLFHPHGF